jgi:transforming growth factor-beta-induced protein
MLKQHLIKTLVAVAALLFAFTFTACEEDDTPEPPELKNLVETAGDLGFSRLAEALTEAGLVNTIADGDNLTVFAPTNEAFDKFLEDNNFADFSEVPDALLENTLKYHVLGSNVTSGDLTPDSYIETLDNSGPDMSTVLIYFDNTDGNKLNGSAGITTADLAATNGTIHVINEVLTRPSVVGHAINNANFSILRDAVIKAELVDDLSAEGPFTVFAPTNGAFEQLFTDLMVSGLDDLTKEDLIPILQYHVVPGNVREDAVVELITNGTTEVGTLNTASNIGLSIVDGKVMLDGESEVVATNVQGVNGVIHVINKVITL